MSRYRLLPTTAQQAVLQDHCGHARYVWNLAVEQHAHWRPGRAGAPGYLEQCRQLTAARAGHPWLAAGSQTVQQQALRDFARAMTAFLDPGNPAGRPSWRKAGRDEGFRITGRRGRQWDVRRVSRKTGQVWVPKAGWVRDCAGRRRGSPAGEPRTSTAAPIGVVAGIPCLQAGEDVKRLRRVVLKLARQLNAASREEGLTPTQASVLGITTVRGPLSLAELTELEGINPTMLSRATGKLDSYDLINRLRDPDDFRAARVEVTPKGRRVYERIDAQRSTVISESVTGFPAGQQAALIAALPALENLAEDLRDTVRHGRDRLRDSPPPD